LWSNGWYLDDTLMEELIDVGTNIFVFSGYTIKDRVRLRGLKNRFQGKAKEIVIFARPAGSFDNRKDIYNEPEEAISNEACGAPLSDISIRSTGDFVLCCRDWKNQVVFGNLHEKNLEQILLEKWDDIEKIYKELVAGNRDCLGICKNCLRWRRP